MGGNNSKNNSNQKQTQHKKGGNGSAGKPAPSTVNEHDRARLELKMQRDKLNKNRVAIETFSDRQTALAKEHLRAANSADGEAAAGRCRDRAKLCLRRKKMHEEQLKKILGLQENIEKMILTVEFATIQQECMTALKSGTAALNDLNKTMSINKVEDVVDAAADAISDAKEITDLLAEHLTQQDEDAVLAEVEKLDLQVHPERKQDQPVTESNGAAKLDEVKIPQQEVGGETNKDNLEDVHVPSSPIKEEEGKEVEEGNEKPAVALA